MLLPQNGKILIVDDKIQQALPLMKVLSKNKIPFTFHTDDTSCLPLMPYDDIRLLFLDIDLTDGVNEDTVKAQLIGVLKKLIKAGTPYILIVWSIKEAQYAELLASLFTKDIVELRPLLKLSLKKTDLFAINADSGEYEIDPNIDSIAIINKKLETELRKNDVLRIFMEWENIVHQCASDTILKFIDFVKKDEFWNSNIQHILLKMAHAQLGKNLKASNEKAVIEATLKTLTTYLTDRVEFSLTEAKNLNGIQLKKSGASHFTNIDGKAIKLKWEDYSTNVLYIDGVEKGRNKVIDKLKGSNNEEELLINSFKEVYRKTSPQMNAELLLSLKNPKKLHPGNTYYVKITGAKKRKLLGTYFKETSKKREGEFVIKDLSNIFFVEMECTPICDYSQKKWLRTRVLPGLLYPIEFNSYLNPSDSLYREIPSIQFKDKAYFLVFDYRLFRSINLEDTKKLMPQFLFRLKNEVVVDVQARISSHISRPGIITIS